ncbi:MAG: hypothetical protein CUN52_06905 [Phototrophicales bacterium]|nr:MAG: hypothetical protein CUN52_06905 [Phototrophicales bacterium]
MMDTRTFDQIYAHVPGHQRQALQEFRQNHPPRTTTHNGVVWEYLVAGDKSNPPLLLLVGGLRVADAAYENIPMLADEFYVITPSYPSVETMAELADGLCAVLDAEGISKAHVLGGSFGGMLAQVFVRRHMNRVDRLIISTTTLPDAKLAERYLTALQMMSELPEAEALEGTKKWMFETIAPHEEKVDFTRAFVDELYSQRLNKADLISTQRCLVDFHTQYHFTADDLAGWGGHIYVLESDNDATFDETVRAKVRELYPNAIHYVFHGAGHSPATTQRDLYFRVVKDFLKG